VSCTNYLEPSKTLEDYHLISPRSPIPGYPRPTLFYAPHSHSIILGHGNALIFQRKFFLRTMKNRLPDPSKICALDFKKEFRRSAICSVSQTIDIDWSIFF
jgi:hypothetical protein